MEKKRDFKGLDYQCNQCQYGVDSKILLKVHMTTQHGMKYNPEIWVQCPLAYSMEDPADPGYILGSSECSLIHVNSVIVCHSLLDLNIIIKFCPAEFLFYYLWSQHHIRLR